MNSDYLQQATTGTKAIGLIGVRVVASETREQCLQCSRFDFGGGDYLGCRDIGLWKGTQKMRVRRGHTGDAVFSISKEQRGQGVRSR